MHQNLMDEDLTANDFRSNVKMARSNVVPFPDIHYIQTSVSPPPKENLMLSTEETARQHQFSAIEHYNN